MKMTQNEILDAVDELATPMIVTDGEDEFVIYPDSDTEVYTAESLSSGRTLRLDFLSSWHKEYSTFYTVLDWF